MRGTIFGQIFPERDYDTPRMSPYHLKSLFAREFEEIRTELDERIKALELRSIKLTDNDRSAIIKTLENRAIEAMADETVRALELKYAEQMRETAQIRGLDMRFGFTRDRLLLEIGRLSRRANVNLLIGITTTAIAVYLLTTLLSDVKEATTDLNAWLPSMIFRIAVSLFVELFSFFFLRLYRSTLHDIKYFQNELTNVELAHAALQTAIVHGDDDALESVLNQLGRTERNFVLKKGESTVAIQQARVDNESIHRIIDACASLSGKSK